MSLEEFRYPISLAIAESACLLLDETDKSLFTSALGILIAQFMGYNRFINYKWNYPPNDKPFDTSITICQSFGYLAGQRVKTPEGDSTVIGVAPLPPPYDYDKGKVSSVKTPNALFFDLDSDESGLNRRKCWPSYNANNGFTTQNGFELLNDGKVMNIWGQSWHSFKGKTWWNNSEYLKNAQVVYFNKFGDPNDPRYKSIKYKPKKNDNNDDVKDDTDKTQKVSDSIFGLDQEEDV